MKKEYIPGKAENRRLALQNELLDSFDGPVYREIFGAAAAPVTVLDVGCNSGEMFVPKLKEMGVDLYLGLDRSEAQVGKAVRQYGDGTFHFRVMDLEAPGFERELNNCLQEHRIRRFRIIHVSMVLLHLKDPQRLLNLLHDYLEDDGVIIVREIDDGLNLAYPDGNAWFDRIYQIAREDELTGDRHTGRRVFHLLQKAGYHSVALRCVGLSTAGFGPEMKREFYDMSYGFILERTAVMLEKYPEDSRYQENRAWAEAHGAEIRELFLKEDFMATLGFMTYVAGK